MRLFVAVNFPLSIKKQILGIQEQLRLQSSKGSFSRPENLHLTLIFIGETPEEKLESIFRIMEDSRCISSDVLFKHTGCFTHSHKELWWIGADPSCRGLILLKKLRERLLNGFLEAGFSVDKRPFNAHISLGREIRHMEPIILDCPELWIPIDRICLMKSERINGILTYSELFSVNLDYEK